MTTRDRREYFKQRYQAQREQQCAERKRRYAKSRETVKAQLSEYYQNNPDSQKERVKRRRQEIREFIQQQKAGLFCVHCGNTDIRVLDFHHRDKSSKEITIATIAQRGWSNEHILRELEKCEVLCANCHRIYHWEERNV